MTQPSAARVLATTDREATPATTKPSEHHRVGAIEVAVGKVAGMTLRGLSHIPDRIKRRLLGGRSIVLDGNTVAAHEQLELLASSYQQTPPGVRGHRAIGERRRRADPGAAPSHRRTRRAAARLLPRRSGDRKHRHPRRLSAWGLPNRPRARPVSRLPAGARAQGARRFRGRLCRIPLGLRAPADLADPSRCGVIRCAIPRRRAGPGHRRAGVSAAGRRSAGTSARAAGNRRLRPVA